MLENGRWDLPRRLKGEFRISKVCYDIREEWCIIWEKPGVDGSLE
jgi:hypothetical protein